MAAEEPRPRRAVAAKDIIAGTMGGVAQVLTAQPFDTIKVRMVVLPEQFGNGVVDAVKQTVGKEGFSALYKGTLSPIAGVGLCVSIQFGILEASKRWLKSNKEAKGQDGTLTIAENVACGMLAGLGNSVVSAPVEHIRIRMQTIVDSAGSQYSGTFDCARQTLRDYGIRGVYKGMVSSMWRETLGYGGYFGAYELVKRKVMEMQGITDPRNVSTSAALLGGGAAGFGMWLPVYPIDAIKSKIQGDSLSNPQYRTMVGTAKSIMKADGITGFYRGFVPCMLRAFPVNAVTFLAFEVVMKVLDTVYY